MIEKMYRGRGIYSGTGQDSWITKSWKTTKEQALSDIDNMSHAYTNARVIEEDVQDYIKKNQRIPHIEDW